MDAAEVVLSGDRGAVGRLSVSGLPFSGIEPEVDTRHHSLVLREARKYRFELAVDEPIARLEPTELFDVDDLSHRTGRLVPGEAVGLVTIEVTTQSGEILRGRFDVRSAKFSDEQAFGTMLSDLAAISLESLHQGFAPSAGAFGTSSGPSARLLYQQFAVLHALLVGSDLRWALNQVVGQTHHAWQSRWDERLPGRPLRGSSRLSHQLSRPGPRVLTPHGPLDSLPKTLLVQNSEETVDTVPNRFVRFTLERWRALAATVVEKTRDLSGAPMRRGVREAQLVVAELDELLSSSLFREVGRLSVYPGDNPVLRGREGYRQVLAAASLVEGALGLEIDIEDPFLVSRRSIATLYEYWTFVRLAQAVERACGHRGIATELFRPSPNGMSLVLRADAQTRLRFETEVAGERILADLFFNNEFRGASWTRPMRPDASLVVRKPDGYEVWLHFDAKYRVDWSTPFETGEPADEEDAERVGLSKRTDLLKMHAYRDAIRNSAGSYVLFPGTTVAEFTVNDKEFLPGLGAFPLRPDRGNEDTAALEQFVSRVLKHVAGAGTRHRRANYWTAKAYQEVGTEASAATPPVGALPPADTAVLFGYVRSNAQWAWIEQVGLYNVRSGQRRGAVPEDGPVLDAPLIVLYGRDGDRNRIELFRRMGSWEGATADALVRLGYPNPRGDSYLVTTLEPLPRPRWLSAVDVQHLAPPRSVMGAPFSASWLDLVLSVEVTSR